MQSTTRGGVTEFVHQLSWDDVPSDVQEMAARCLLDLAGTLVAGSGTELSQIVRDAATAIYGGDEATLLLDGRRASAPGAVWANASSIDAMDMHDGYRRAKGHAGVNVFPAALAAGESCAWDGRQFLAALVMGYEIALRAGLALHATACDYHTSGAWGALGAAAVFARALGLTAGETRHALGIAEYHGPRSQMMRVIDAPTMLKDGSGWGSMAGVVAARLAAAGFTGAPAITVEAAEVAPLWATLGSEWLMRELYFKPLACCRWAQPAVEAACAVIREHRLRPEQIEEIKVYTFAAATRLAVARPANTEQAQYSLPYPVAAAAMAGRLDPEQMLQPALSDERILALAERVEMIFDPELEARFPAEALARVTMRTVGGQTVSSGVYGARGDPANPLANGEIDDKFTRLTAPYLDEARREALRAACWQAAELQDVGELVALFGPPAKTSAGSAQRRHALLQALASAPARIRQAVEPLADAQAGWQPDGETWSIRMTVAHLAHAEPLFRERFRRMLAEENPLVPAFGPESAQPHSERSIGALLRAFEEERQQTIALLSELPPAAWSRTAVHETLGQTTILRQVENILDHDVAHLGQVVELQQKWAALYQA